jgi:hypothetical protein
MIPSTASEFSSDETGTLRAGRVSSSTHHNRAARHHATVSAGARSSFGFAEPPFGSLWDASLLDRFTLPLTRYHE